ncbi:molybdopterin converting factor subunit 1 [Ectothiorhodospira mobilis]|uniref:Molybdopterin synthase sulfur carrier subunit n=1 Tax=Ectothiorhodospira mobilis TaxID=195064 RepID=A0A1I4PC47_ECTMO|nr:molybdopterin converting factor subunit 1 [Ectothiorhodospira mobilis]MCG5534895.1 molybdopterin converting factor subunit 1 [Ectothiorhodospira mobilis]SFM25378.1 molybdopterin synthase subunit MoaD [Ectothiorhodospira mobilis]
MAIHVRYFARLREELGREGDTLDAKDLSCVADVWARAHPGQERPPGVLMAVNQAYAHPQDPVRDGDEVAFFPPVTGG